MGVQLMAITTTGVRLFFSPFTVSYGYQSIGDGSQRHLQLLHVRLPPSNLLHPDEQSRPLVPQQPTYGHQHHPNPPSNTRPYVLIALDNALYSDGLTLAAQVGDTDGTDFLLCLSPDLTRISSFSQTTPQQPQITYTGVAGPQRPPLAERAAILAIPGRTWGMAVMPRPGKVALTSIMSSADGQAPVPMNELAYQFLEPSRQLMVLTNNGLTVLAKRRALDWLRDVLEEVHAEGSSQAIVEFRDRCEQNPKFYVLESAK